MPLRHIDRVIWTPWHELDAAQLVRAIMPVLHVVLHLDSLVGSRRSSVGQASVSMLLTSRILLYPSLHDNSAWREWQFKFAPRIMALVLKSIPIFFKPLSSLACEYSQSRSLSAAIKHFSSVESTSALTGPGHNALYELKEYLNDWNRSLKHATVVCLYGVWTWDNGNDLDGCHCKWWEKTICQYSPGLINGVYSTASYCNTFVDFMYSCW